VCMRFQCLQDNLKKGLHVAGRIPHKSTNLPILQNILLRATDKGVIECISNNLEMGVRSTIRGKVEKEGAYTFDARLLTEYVNLLPNEKVDLELKEDVLEVRCANYYTKIRGVPAAEFPPLPNTDKINPLTCGAIQFRDALEQVLFTISPHESRQEISGASLSYEVKDKILTLVGTDSYRLGERKILTHSGPENDFSTIIPLRTLQELLRILYTFENEDERLTLYIQEGQILFTLDTIEIISRLVDGVYPEYRQIIPQNTTTTAIVATATLSRLVKSASLFSKAGVCDVVFTSNTAQQQLTLSASSTQFGENAVTLEGDIQGPDITTTLNHRYVIEGLNALHAGKVMLKIADSTTPCIFEPADTPKQPYLYLVMPIRR